MFVATGGIKAVLSIVDLYRNCAEMNEENEEDYLNFELENLITFTLTAACYDPEEFFDDLSIEDFCDFDRDYQTFKPVMLYL